MPASPEKPGEYTSPGNTWAYEKRGSETLISSQKARFAKRAILRKPRKTPGFHPGHLRCPFRQIGPIRNFHDLGEFSVLGKGSDQGSGVGKKGPPKRNTGLLGALYEPRFEALLAIGTRCVAGLPSVQVSSDVRQVIRPGAGEGSGIFDCGWGRGVHTILVRVSVELFPENFPEKI